MEQKSLKTITIDGVEYNFHLGGSLTLATPKLISEAFAQLDNH